MTRHTTLIERAADVTTDAVGAAREVTLDFLENTAKPFVDEFVEETAKPFVENTAKPKLQEAAARTAPLVAAGAGLAAQRATQAKEFVEAKSLELTGHPQPKKRRGRRLLTLALLGGLIAAAAVLARRFLGDSGEWTSATASTGTSTTTAQNPGETFATEEPTDDLTTPINKPPYSSN
jgi:hypothetical protein